MKSIQHIPYRVPAMIAMLAVTAFAATLHLEDPDLSDTPPTVGVSLGGSSQIVGVQFDLVFPDDQASPGIPSLTSATPQHEVIARLISAGVFRVMIYSSSNAVLPEDVILSSPFEFSSTAPNGGPVIRIHNLIFTDANGQSINSYATYGPLAEWRELNFLDREWSDPFLGGDNGDLDGDGVLNLAEYLAVTDPRVDDGLRPLVQGVETDPDDSRYLVLRWWERKDNSNVSAVALGSTDLVNEEEILAGATGVEDTDARQMEVRIPMQDREKYFLRLGFFRQ